MNSMQEAMLKAGLVKEEEVKKANKDSNLAKVKKEVKDAKDSKTVSEG